MTYNPSMVNLTQSVNIVAKEVIGVVVSVPRIKGQNFNFESAGSAAATATATATGVLVATANAAVSVSTFVAAEEAAVAAAAAGVLSEEKEKGGVGSYYESISDDADILRIVVQIMNGMSSTATELQKYLSYWDKYKALWDLDKEVFIRKYSKANRTPTQFDTDISRYRTQQVDGFIFYFCFCP